MYEDSNLSLTSVQRGAKQTSKQKVTFVTIESREFFGSSQWLYRQLFTLTLQKMQLLSIILLKVRDWKTEKTRLYRVAF